MRQTGKVGEVGDHRPVKRVTLNYSTNIACSAYPSSAKSLCNTHTGNVANTIDG